LADELNEISKEFIDENRSNLCQFMPKSRRTGPYSPHDKEIRRNEVYRFHFEYGYSARKISELTKIHRNTINGDLQYWYSKIVNNSEGFDPEDEILKKLERFEIQRTRIREQLDKESNFERKMTLERFLFDIESKIINIQIRFVDSSIRQHDSIRNYLNEWLKKKGQKERYFTFYDLIRVSNSTSEKIFQIIKEDRKRAGPQ